MMGVLATVRYLSMEQLRRLFFADRHIVNLHKRLLALAGEGKHGVAHPWLKRLSYLTREGAARSAWTLTPLGYNVADAVMPTPPKRPATEPGSNFMEHGLMLNELYVQLLEAPVTRALADARARAQQTARPSRAFARLQRRLYARAAQPGFQWLSHDEVRLPWQEYVMKKHRSYDRVIVPDAVLELPGAGRRYFLECETGSHSIRAQSDEKEGATVAKLARYVEYVLGYAGNPSPGERATWYTRQYPDGLTPRLVFLVPTATREASVNRAIKECQGHFGRSIAARAFTVEGMATSVLEKLGVPALPARKPRRPLVSAEVQLIRGFFEQAIATHHAVRVDARQRGMPLPPYPASREQMQALLEKLV